jgi:4-amino-4-deoxy-L-arabinose transferase-like glycosyltransferase
VVFCAFVTYLAFFYQLGRLPFFGSDEPRYAQIAQEMAESGDYVTPTLEGRPWLEKAPLLFWVEAFSFKLFGVSEFTARLPIALMAILGALGLAAMMGALGDERRGVLTYLALVTSGMYSAFARAGSTDLPLTVSLTGALALGYLWHRHGGMRWAGLTGALLGLAVLAKGPVAILLFAAVFFVFFLVTDSVKWRISEALLALLAMLAIAIPWFAMVWMRNGENFFWTFWVNHHIARYVTDLHHHVQPFWYYLPFVLVGSFPWGFFLPSSAIELWRHRGSLATPRVNLSLFLWIWALVPLAFFSAGGSKLPGYILPVIPPLAALAAIQWNRFVRGEVAIYGTMRIQLAALSSFSLLLGLVLVLGFELRYRAGLSGVLIAVPLIGSVVWGHHEFRKRRAATLFIILVSGVTLTLALLFRLGSPIVGQFHSTYALVQAAKPRISAEKPLVFYRFFHHSARYYADFMTTREPIQSPQELFKYAQRHPQERYLLITKKEGWDQLSRIAAGRLVVESGDFYLVEISKPPEAWELPEEPETTAAIGNGLPLERAGSRVVRLHPFR